MIWLALIIGGVIGMALAFWIIGLCLGSATEYPEVEHEIDN